MLRGAVPALFRFASFGFAILGSPALGYSADFGRDVQPVFQQRCIVCHGPRQQLSGLRLDDPTSAKRVIVPGKSAESRLIQMLEGSSGKTMPPTGAKLSAEQIAGIRRWIDEGAKWPASARIERHWAWEPIVRSQGDVHSFNLARLAKENIAPSPEADRATLLRRISLDLT